ncbi:MAG: ADP-ribose pyrophosphatase [Flavobacteriia bacterium]|nr:MAG: ADP-ribose pyrophosphatase [Flavobacteriia bacterium]
MDPTEQLNIFKRIKAISEIGLIYAQDPYDRERYEELKQIGLKLLEGISDTPIGVLENFFMPQEDYPTPKVDIRGFVLNEKDEILMARESLDGKWSIPGGWADIGSTPSEIVVKEIEEETGIKAEVVRLLAVYYKKMHPHPPALNYVYKIVFQCRIVGGEMKSGFDILDTNFFSLDNLPELSEERILESQIQDLFQMATSSDPKTYFD